MASFIPIVESPVETRLGSVIDRDLETARRVLGGDRNAFNLLYREHLGGVFAVCFRMLADQEEARELTQQTIVAVWEKLGTFRGESPLSAWIRKIAVRTVLDHLRGRNRLTDRVRFDSEHAERGVDAGMASPDDHVDLGRAIARLPREARVVLVLHDIEGYTHEEIAAMTGVVPGTSKSQLHRARRLLREGLTQ
jgi:RNA polymerase sigma factor (sigma-70 family)